MEAFRDFVKEESIELVFISESWERENETLDKVIKIEDFEVISNVKQRKGQGGRPAIVVNKNKFGVHYKHISSNTMGSGGSLVHSHPEKHEA